PNLRKGNGLIGVEVENYAIRALDIILPTAPDVKLEHPHLCGSGQSGFRFDEQVILAPALLFLNSDSAELRGKALASVLLEETGLCATLRTADQTHRPPFQMRQHARRYPEQIVCQVSFSDTHLRKKHAIRVGQRYPC